MSRKRWGTLSVRDHLKEHAFVAELLLYDRVVVPIPPPDNPAESKRWRKNRWNPDRQSELLAIVGDDLCARVPWTEELQKQHRGRLAVTRKVDDAVKYGLTSLMIPQVPFEAYHGLVLPPGEPAPHVLPAYPTPAALLEDIPLAPVQQPSAGGRQRVSADEERDLAVTLTREMLMPRGVLEPKGVRPGTELLRDAVGLVRDEEYKRNRVQFYEWEEDQLIKGHTTRESIDTMWTLLSQHEQIVRRAWKDAKWKRVFTVMTVGTGLAGVLAGAASTLWFAQATPAQIAGSAAGAVTVAANVGRFLKFDRKPTIHPGETAPAAMIASIRRRLLRE